MSYTLLDGKVLSEEILAEIKDEVEALKKLGRKIPHLAAILVGTDGASMTYVNKNCEKVGFKSTLIQKPAETTESELLEIVHQLNNDADIDGFIVQLPLPHHISEKLITDSISPNKDVDGFHPFNVGKLALGLETFVSATPNGVMEMLRRYQIETTGKYCVVIGRSNIVGSPMAMLLSKPNKSEVIANNGFSADATVTICHSRTQNLKEITSKADILVVAIGKAEFVTADMVKNGAVVVDVGIHRIPDETKKSGFRLVGDVKFDEVAPKTSFITPVPGGVGLMTICSLLQNTLKAGKN
jgi:methylenetetrahydrofolate dehydrogenase (NADP+)/methenyltetrahydrofolate cyclohydrolase